jgi:2-dehydropantoate 2-reductase
MWEKWVFLATLAGSTCLMRASVGDIAAAPGGAEFVLHLFDECCSIAAAAGYEPGTAFLERTRRTLIAAGSKLTASMLRDIENDAPVEADHIIGDLLQRGRSHNVVQGGSMLEIVYAHLKAYEKQRPLRGAA